MTIVHDVDEDDDRMVCRETGTTRIGWHVDAAANVQKMSSNCPPTGRRSIWAPPRRVFDNWIVKSRRTLPSQERAVGTFEHTRADVPVSLVGPSQPCHPFLILIGQSHSVCQELTPDASLASSGYWTESHDIFTILVTFSQNWVTFSEEHLPIIFLQKFKIAYMIFYISSIALSLLFLNSTHSQNKNTETFVTEFQLNGSPGVSSCSQTEGELPETSRIVINKFWLIVVWWQCYIEGVIDWMEGTMNKTLSTQHSSSKICVSKWIFN